MERKKIGNWREQLKEKALQSEQDREFLIIVKSKKKDYVPKEVQVRSRIDPYMFTAKVKGNDLAGVAFDKNLSSIELNQKLPLIE